MTAIALFALFASIAVFALGAIAHAWRHYAGRLAALRDELRVTERGVAVRYSWRPATLPRAAATVYKLRFTSTADCLPFHPEHELRAAA